MAEVPGHGLLLYLSITPATIEISMTTLQNSRLTITAKISIRSAQSRKYYERAFEFETLNFDKIKSECIIKFKDQDQLRLESFLKEYACEEYYIEVPAGKLFFTFRNKTLAKDSTIHFQVYKEEKIAYPEKEKV